MENITIRDMRPQDYEAYYVFLSQLHAMHQKERPDIFRLDAGIPPRKVFESDLQKDDREYFLAVSGEEPIGRSFNENALRLYQKLGMKPLLNMEQRL